MPAKLMACLWPSGGWTRASRYVALRLSRIPGSPYSLAAGFACGAFASFLPFPGFHFVLAALFALAIRSNVLASAIGTAVGNPWTFPFIWAATYELGTGLGFGTDAAGSDEATGRWQQAFDAASDFEFTAFLELAWPVLAPMTAGGVILGLLSGLLLYALLAPIVRAYQDRRHGRIAQAQGRRRRP